MQTFLPVPDFTDSARALDRRRLGKQRVEALQILRALTRERGAWVNHPAVRMWRGYEEALVRYGLEVCEVWRELGFADTCADKLVDDFLAHFGAGPVRTQAELAAAGELPPWLGDPRLHASHRSALVRKEPDLYRDRFPDAVDDLEYFWPVDR